MYTCNNLPGKKKEENQKSNVREQSVKLWFIPLDIMPSFKTMFLKDFSGYKMKHHIKKDTKYIQIQLEKNTESCIKMKR